MAEVAKAKKAGWKAPPRRYFGPKDPDTGEMLEEPEYEHTAYPKIMYHPDGDTIEVSSEDEHAALGAEWKETPYGGLTHPSAEDIKAERLAKLTAKKGK